MSYCTSVYITREEAEKRVKALLLAQYEDIVEIAVKNMTNSDLTMRISDEFYDYNIKGKK